jgi:hypothetical protein
MPLVMTGAQIRGSVLSLALAACASFQLQPAAAADKLLKVDWANAEIDSFVKDQASNSRHALGPAAEDKFAKLKLPVVGFAAMPGVVENTFRLGPQPEAQRDVVVDEKNPVWYQIVERYGDMTISIEADLRVQHEFPDSYPVYDKLAPGAAPQTGPEISVFDDDADDGVEGLMAEYTIMKFGVPYTVKIECSAEAREQCRDTSQIAKDSELLAVISANPPQ